MPLVSHQPAAALANAALAILMSWAATATAESDTPSAPPPPTARPRLRVAPGNATETDIRDCLRNAVDAANAEDLDGFINCFAGSAKAKIRKPAALRFVQHDVSMELVDAHVIKVGKTAGEIAVRYRLALSDDRFDVVSLVAMKHEQGYWRINSEKIQSYEHQSPSMCSPSRYACFGATCNVGGRRR
jgi:hypothetical protein